MRNQSRESLRFAIDLAGGQSLQETIKLRKIEAQGDQNYVAEYYDVQDL
jgi:hypothetical protein